MIKEFTSSFFVLTSISLVLKWISPPYFLIVSLIASIIYHLLTIDRNFDKKYYAQKLELSLVTLDKNLKMIKNIITSALGSQA